MFTGIIQKTGRITAWARTGGAGHIEIDCAPWEQPLAIGESIAVSGVCLTLTSFKPGSLRFDLLDETFSRTSLGGMKAGSVVNLERALRVGDSMGGHFVTGHVDGVGKVRAITPAGRDRVVSIDCPRELLSGMVPKGSIALDGVSLTIVDLTGEFFSVHIIPHTLRETTIGGYRPGDAVNLETDMMGKYVCRYFEQQKPAEGITWEKLRKAGFAG